MAAGTGTRLRPLTLKTPKPLIAVNGKVMIEGLIEALQSKGITDIVIVVGHLHEQFGYLKEKYNVRFIYNGDYLIANNIASLYYARKELDSCIILDGDQIVNDTEIIKNFCRKSGYACSYSETPSKEWLLDLNGQSKIISCSRNGGDKGWELRSLSYWTKKDARKLSELIKFEYERGNTDVYWDDVAIFLHKGEIPLYGYKIAKDAITEIDSLDELISADDSYRNMREEVKDKC